MDDLISRQDLLAKYDGRWGGDEELVDSIRQVIREAPTVEQGNDTWKSYYLKLYEEVSSRLDPTILMEAHQEAFKAGCTGKTIILLDALDRQLAAPRSVRPLLAQDLANHKNDSLYLLQLLKPKEWRKILWTDLNGILLSELPITIEKV